MKRVMRRYFGEDCEEVAGHRRGVDRRGQAGFGFVVKSLLESLRADLSICLQQLLVSVPAIRSLAGSSRCLAAYSRAEVPVKLPNDIVHNQIQIWQQTNPNQRVVSETTTSTANVDRQEENYDDTYVAFET